MLGRTGDVHREWHRGAGFLGSVDRRAFSNAMDRAPFPDPESVDREFLHAVVEEEEEGDEL